MNGTDYLYEEEEEKKKNTRYSGGVKSKEGESGGGNGGGSEGGSGDNNKKKGFFGKIKNEDASKALGSLASLTSNLAAAHTASFKGLSPGSNLVSKSGKDPAPRTLDSITKDDDGNINYSSWHKQIKEEEKKIGNIA